MTTRGERAVEFELRGSDFHLTLPVTLSASAQREALLTTNREVDRYQVFCVPNLRHLPPDVREEVVAVNEQIVLHPQSQEVDEGTSVKVARYGPLIRTSPKDQWGLFDVDTVVGETTAIDQFFFVGEGGRTRGLLDELEARGLPVERLYAMLDGAPLVDDLWEMEELTLDAVLTAYKAALDLAANLEQIARTGATATMFLGSVAVTDELVMFTPAGSDSSSPAGFVRAADPDTFDRLSEAAKRLDAESGLADVEAINELCDVVRRLRDMGLPDAGVWDVGVKPRIEAIFDKHAEAAREAAARQAYEADRAIWIEKLGSRRLKLAAERGYKHDGIYRDERLRAELPGFIAVKGKLKVGEDVNPSEEGLDLESEVLEKLEGLKLDDLRVRLVWVTGEGYDVPDGEYVEVSGYLGRHTVYRHVEPDIPF